MEKISEKIVGQEIYPKWWQKTKMAAFLKILAKFRPDHHLAGL
jgi:hypothetical protein